MGEMDLDLADYDQVDEAKFFMSHKLGLSEAPPAGQSLVIALSSSSEHSSGGAPGANDETNCENDFVFLPPAPTSEQQQEQRQPTAPNSRGNDARSLQQGGSSITSTAVQRLGLPSPPCAAKNPTSLPLTSKQATTSTQSSPPATRASHPLMTISPNAGVGKNPFYNPHQISPDSASSQAYQPFWMRPETFASKPIGLLDVSSNNSCSPNHLSDLMHQIITKSDSIYIAIPCAYCQEPKACPPSDISAWLNHMNRVHNCKVCPICNKLVGLGPMRDIEIMRKHVIAHIDDDWLEKRSAKTNFSFGLQQQWFAGGHCNVKDPRTLGVGYKK